MTTFTATTSAATAEGALARVTAHLPIGFAITGRVSCRSERHQLWHVEVEVQDASADVNDCWVILTSYGISPSAELGSTWERTLGVTA